MAALNAALNLLIERDLPVTDSWISDAELLANPQLVKTMSVSPPMGQGANPAGADRAGRGAD